MEDQSQRVRAKRWCVTINNYNRADIGQFDILKDKCEYWCFGKEIAPTTNTPHLQCYIVFKNPREAKTCHSIFPSKGHWEKQSPNSSPEQCANYCKKEGDWEEFGNLPVHAPLIGGAKTAEKWAITKQLAMEGRIEEIDAKIFLGHYKNLKMIKADYKTRPADLDWKQPPNVWIWGPTRTGKSWFARKEIIGDNAFYIKNAANKWWDKYDGEPYVLIEDMDTTHIYQG